MRLRETVRAVAIVFNILALLGLAVLLLLDSSDDGPWLLPVVVCALLAALLWPGQHTAPLAARLAARLPLHSGQIKHIAQRGPIPAGVADQLVAQFVADAHQRVH